MKKLALVLIVLALSQVGATDCGGVIRDPGFDLWCGESLCAWKLVRGDIERVGTWNQGDSGVSFVGEDTAIQQTAPVNSFDGNCIELTFVADVEDNAEVFLNIDVEADGSIDRQERVPTSSWKKLTFHLLIDPPYDGIRFELAKRGPGRAVLANIGAALSSGCEGLEPIGVGQRPNGAACIDAGDCASARCGSFVLQPPGGSMFDTVCLGCDPAAPACGTGEVCGLGPPLSPVLGVPLECVPEGARELAEQCVNGNQCATGICNAAFGGVGVCSACAASADCGGGACAPAWTVTDDNIFTPDFIGPNVCRPGEHAGAPGAACGADADCASAHCSGSVRKVCFDGRPCADDAGCPAGGDLKPGTCTTVGIEGGTCD